MRHTDQAMNGIVIFVSVARAGSFTQAAAQLGITKSAVGKSITRLEERLGLKLFHRSTRQLTLSVDGEEYFASCANALDEIAEAEETLSSKQRTPSGRLRIDMPAAYGRQVILPILFNMAKKYPKLQFAATFTDYYIDPIEEGVDLLIRFGDLRDSNGLIARRLTTQRQIICASPLYLQSQGCPQSLDDLAKHHCIAVYRRGHQQFWSVCADQEDTSKILVPAAYLLSDGDSIVEAARQGLGLCQMPEFMLRSYLDSGELIEVLSAFAPRDLEVHAVWPKARNLLPKVRHVVDELINELK
ncbi:LysR family transcriptional regulator [Pseudomonas sp. R5(2019)]|uniref:LysR family transcriptional regulator n=1 Tax=Pseudomonas sp. R5(2019) TaxID=2697566 RepID=UPI0014127DB2|nr:LysR family transcriptional regulator [Pseudomonas sp. R5(2019)]NBA96619.1 LysR family transcriptional regulator [Pseudomonas sp. R5(2019)]